MRYIKGELVLSDTDKKHFLFALQTLEQNIGTSGDKKADKDAQQSFNIVKLIAIRLGVDYD